MLKHPKTSRYSFLFPLHLFCFFYFLLVDFHEQLFDKLQTKSLKMNSLDLLANLSGVFFKSMYSMYIFKVMFISNSKYEAEAKNFFLTFYDLLK